jgi:hypothetical protein
LYGDGSCTCDFGWYTSSGLGQCGTCDPAIVFGCSNTLQCPNDCTSHGACEQVDATNQGKCRCDTTYAGADCSKRCPGILAPTVACSLKGTCNDGRDNDGTCSCQAAFTGLGCEKCKSGYWGASCNQICPGGLLAPCNNSGTCLRTTGTCQCAGGYGGANCNISCPVGANSQPCTGNGYCDANANCVCFQESVHGYWNGSVCDRCNDIYRGGDCKIRCPIINGAVCNGRGTCNSEGKCECTYPACGRICDTEWNGTRCNSCPIDGF